MSQGRLRRFHHITFVVADLNRASAAWEQIFGGTRIGEREEGEPRYVRRAQFNAGDAFFELAQPLDDRSPLWNALQTRGEGPYSVTAQVADLDAATAAVRAGGGSIVDGLGGPGSVFVDPASAEGVLLELTDDDTTVEGPRTWKAIHHFVVPTPDMDAAAQTFERLFGGETEPSHSEGDMPLRSRHYPVGDAWFGFAQPFAADHAVARYLRDRGRGIFAIGLTTDDKEATAASIQARGGTLMGPGLTVPGQQIFIHPKHAPGTLLDLY